MRRIALISVAAFLVVCGSAGARGTEIVQVHNQTAHNLEISSVMRGTAVHRVLSPHDYLVLSEVPTNDCVRVRLLHDKATHRPHCESFGHVMHVACDLPADYQCILHAGEQKDVLISVQHHPRH
jgi:hypothetical protein